MTTYNKPFHLTIKNNSPEYARLYRLSKKYDQPLSAISQRHYELLTDKPSTFKPITAVIVLEKTYQIISGQENARLQELCQTLSTIKENAPEAYSAFLSSLKAFLSTEHDTTVQNPYSRYCEASNGSFKGYVLATESTERGTYNQRKVYSLAKSLGVSPKAINPNHLPYYTYPHRMWSAIDNYIKLEELLPNINLSELRFKVMENVQAFDNFEKILQKVLTTTQ